MNDITARIWTWRRDANGTVRVRRTTTAPAVAPVAAPAQFQGATARPIAATILGASRLGRQVWEG